MMRRSGGFWLGLVVVVATFAAEPKASAEFTVNAFQALGEFGGSVVSEFASDDDSVTGPVAGQGVAE